MHRFKDTVADAIYLYIHGRTYMHRFKDTAADHLHAFHACLVSVYIYDI